MVLKGHLADMKFTDTIRGSILSAYSFGASGSIWMSVYQQSIFPKATTEQKVFKY